MDDLQAWVGPTLSGLADALDDRAWDDASLCEGWQVQHVVAHLTMPARLTPEQFGAEIAAARGDFGVVSETVARRDAALPREVLLEQLRSEALRTWQPPGGGSTGALSHAVIHSLDVTLPLGLGTVAPQPAVDAVLQALADNRGAWFSVDLDGRSLEATDTGWTWGDGEPLRTTSGGLVVLLAGRTLPDGTALPRR